MKNKSDNYYSCNNIGFTLYLLNTSQKSLTTILSKLPKYHIDNSLIKNNSEDDNYLYPKKNRQKSKERFLEFIIKSSENKRDNNLNKKYNLTCEENKFILLEGIKTWEKYGVKNKYSDYLFEEISKITINDVFFGSKEENHNNLLNFLKSKIININNNIKFSGSAIFCGVFLNKELNMMISVSIGNILYSILRENSQKKYEIIYISNGQYHDINVPFQLSPLNQDYNYLNIQYHSINLNDIIIITKKKELIFEILNKINQKNDYNFNIEHYGIIAAKISLINENFGYQSSSSISTISS